jgi:hypothetical protein
VDRSLFSGAYKTGRDVYVERDLPGKANPWLSKRRRIAKAQKVLSAALRSAIHAPCKPRAYIPCTPVERMRSTEGRLHGGPDNKFDPRLNVFTVEEYESNGKTQKKWTKIGAAFPHKEGSGFSIELRAFPIDGRLVGLSPDTDEGNNRSK